MFKFIKKYIGFTVVSRNDTDTNSTVAYMYTDELIDYLGKIGQETAVVVYGSHGKPILYSYADLHMVLGQ